MIATPAAGNAVLPGVAWMADNSVFADRYPGNAAYLAWLAARAQHRPECRLVVAPDVVGNAVETLKRSVPMFPVIRAAGYPVALAAQDGLRDLTVPWGQFDALFIGGSTEWKVGPEARELTAQAKSRGLWVHMGRVNSLRRLQYATDIGCDSADGTYLAFGPDVNLPKLLRWLDIVNGETTVSRASDLEAARLAKERIDARCGALTELANPIDLEHIAAQMLAEGTYVVEQRKSGWKSRSEIYTAAAGILEQWARDLAAYLERDKPPMRPPLETITGPTRHAHLDPTNGPISAQITSGLLSQATDGPVTPDVARSISEAKTVDDKLDVAFGPVSPRAEIINLQCRAEYPRKGSEDRSSRIVRCGKLAAHVDIPGSERHAEWIEDDPAHGPVSPEGGAWGPEWDLPVDTVHITATPANYAWCDATTGARGYVGSATCPDCIARYDAYDEAANKALALNDPTGPMTGVSAAYLWPVDGTEPIVMAAGSAGTIAGPTIDLSWNAKGEATVSIPQFSEPGPAPARQTQQRMTFKAVREHGMARMRGEDHRSYSQVSSFAECGVRYALGDLETPAWWDVGGTAVHYACEWLNRETLMAQNAAGRPGPERVRTDFEIETLWTNCLNRATSEAIAEHPTVSPDQWRAAKKGAEGYDWWRINGVDMVRRWVTRLTWLYDQGWRVAEFNGVPAIEYNRPMWIGDIKVENIIDLVLTRDDGTLLIVDAKSGASAPDSTAQLGQYAHALSRLLTGNTTLSMSQVRILGAYWLARTDMLTPVDVTKSDTATDLRELHPWDELEYLITTMHAAESAGLYLSNRTRWCVSCGVNGLCPVGPS